MRLANKVAVLFGAGQSPGQGLGNGRATVLTFAREGAKVMAVDRDLTSAEETSGMVREAGGECVAYLADVTNENQVATAIAATVAKWGRLDILHYNVGVSLAGGDASPTEITVEAFDRIIAINLRGAVLACKHALPIMRKQGSGAIVTISSAAAYEDYPTVAYKITKSALISYTQQVAIQNAEYGIRANVILPGLIDTPMAVDTRARIGGEPREDVVARRNARVPLRGKQGTAWDIADAALYLCSDEAQFVTGVALPVDGGRLVKVG